MASNQANEVEEMIKDLKKNPGFKNYIILNNDGIVIKWDQVGEPMPYAKAVQHAHLVLDLCAKCKQKVKNLFDVSCPLPAPVVCPAWYAARSGAPC